MTYSALASSQGKQAVQIVEIAVERCTRTYGTSPCLAAIGTTGSQKCFNTLSTCQYASAYNPAPLIYRFSSVRIDGLQQPGDAPTIPTLVSLKTDPTVLTPSKGLGVRASVTATIQDHPWPDQFTDPYLSTRTYDPETQGSFWGKWLRRHRFYQNRIMTIYTGFLNEDGSYDIANFKTRKYIITQISGPTISGQVTITGKDPLRLVDDDKRKWPTASQVKLATAVDAVTTTVVVADTLDELSFWWNQGQRYIRLEDEIMHATAISGLGTGTVTLTVTRGSMPTFYDFAQNVAAAHAVDVTAQWCWTYDNAMIYDILYDFLHTIVGLDTAFLPYSAWKAEIDANFPYLHFSCMLAKPAGMKTVLQELTELPILLWWHEREQVIKLKGFRFIQTLPAQLNDSDSIIAESVSVTEDVTALATESWIYFAPTWPLANMKQIQTYRVIDIAANADRESANEYGAPYVKAVASRWIPPAGASLAATLNATNLTQYQDVRKAIAFTVDPKDDNYWVGDLVGISTKYVQDEYGAPAVRNYLITQAEEVYDNNGLKIQLVALEQFSYARLCTITPPSIAGVGSAPPIYSLASASDKIAFGYMGYTSGTFPDGAPNYVMS